MNKLFSPQVAEQTIYFPKFAEQSFFSQKKPELPPPQESNGRPLITKLVLSVTPASVSVLTSISLITNIKSHNIR